MRPDYAQLPRVFALSRLSYYLDFALAPAAALALILIEVTRDGATWSTAIGVASGILLWALAEYLIHRVAFHGPLRRLHDVHHHRPAAYIGVASWGTSAAFAVLWGALALSAGAAIADSLTAGVLLGYLAYIAIHDRMHHGDRARFGRYVAFMFALHAGHHRGGHFNFGVTSPLLDIVFRTYRSPH
jgi:sterol desaturase/sphingolipid hydroxylase (fatty acid hydroxylase superfamily)